MSDVETAARPAPKHRACDEGAVDLTVLIVNYNSARYTVDCVRDILDQDFEGKLGGTRQIVVIENKSPNDDLSLLEPLKDWGVEVVHNPVNNGYAGGNNLGLERAHGEYLLVINPDVRMPQGTLEKMLAFLRGRDDVAAVSPRTYLDDHFEMMLPPNVLPTLKSHAREVACHLFESAQRRFSLARTKDSLKYWTAREPIEAPMLTGCCMLMRRDLPEKIGGLFDEGFPLYYEDTDFFQRARQKGFKLYYLCDVDLVHYFNRSAATVFNEAMGRYYRAQSYYYRKHFGALGYRVYKGLNLCLAFGPKIGIGPPKFTSVIDLGVLRDEPPTFECGVESDRLLWEITTDPFFFLAAAMFGPGPEFRISDAAWSFVTMGEFYVRAIRPEPLEILRTWKFRRETE
ncbi:MAG: glycosyltransferase family 2 protein [Planctomycetota bacterium]